MDDAVAADRLHDALEEAYEAVEAAVDAVTVVIGRIEFIRRGHYGPSMPTEVLDPIKEKLLEDGANLGAIAETLSILVDEGPSKLP